MSDARNAPYRTLLHTFQGHEEEINRIAWSPDGRYLASSSFDGAVRIWDVQAGTLHGTLRGHSGPVYGVSWSPDGRLIAACSQDGRVSVWDNSSVHRLLFGIAAHTRDVYDVVWVSLNNAFLASCSEDARVAIWNINLQQKSKRPYVWHLHGHFSEMFSLAYIRQSSKLASGSSNGSIHLWRLPDANFLMQMVHSEARYLIAPSTEIEEYWRMLRGSTSCTLQGHTDAVYSLAWMPDNKLLASASKDQTIRLWDLETERVTRVLEWHTASVTSVSFSCDGRLLASKSCDGMVALWRTDSWELVGSIEITASNGAFAGLAFHPSFPLLATASEKDKVVQIWQLDIPVLLGLAPPQPTVHYVNAKVVLAGDSGVGKTALGRALAGLDFIPTDSTHGRFIYSFKNNTVELADGRQEQREVFLWDLAGQSGSRLVHQLHLPEAAVVLLIFSEMGGGDPLIGIRYWGRALRVVQGRQTGGGWSVTKFLVEARIDSGRVRLSREQIEEVLQEWGLSKFYCTSAQENDGISELALAIEEAIVWDMLPKVSSTELFQSIKTFLIERKESGYVVESFSNLYRAFLKQASFAEEPPNLRAQFETCIGHLDAQGLLRRLNFGGFVLLLPEKLDEYADALVRTVQAEANQLGSIAEAEVLAGSFALPPHIRLGNQDEEKILLLALVQDLLSYEIALREETFEDGSYMVFPSEVMRQPQAMDQQETLSKTIVFTFEGPVLNIYATLAVRLAHSGFFEKQELWQNCMVFAARAGGICRCELREPVPGEGRGELALFFDAQASEETRYYFETYIQAHLQGYVGEEKVQRQRVFLCQDCQTLLSNDQVKRGHELSRARLFCPMGCGMIDIRDRLDRLARRPDSRVQEQMEREADAHKKRAVDRSLLQGKEQTQSHDVYISYSPHDEPAARKLRDDLQERGYFPWLVDWDAIPGRLRQQQVDERIEQVQAAVVLIGNHEMDARRELEVETMTNQFSQRKCPVIPVFLAGASPNPRIPPFLQNMVEVDFRKQDPNPLERLILGIQNKRV